MRSFRVSFHNPRPTPSFFGESFGKTFGKAVFSAKHRKTKKAEPLVNQEIPLERYFSKIILKFPKEFPNYDLTCMNMQILMVIKIIFLLEIFIVVLIAIFPPFQIYLEYLHVFQHQR